MAAKEESGSQDQLLALIEQARAAASGNTELLAILDKIEKLASVSVAGMPSPAEMMADTSPMSVMDKYS